MSEIDVYFVDVNVSEDVIDALSKLLTPPELTRADRYRFADDRRRSIVARAATRRFLGRRLDADPQSLVIVEEEHGKPALRDREFEFNASPSGDFVALALASETPVGIDVERRRTLHDAFALARRYFSSEEVAVVENTADIESAFLTIWTSKEAIVKASGKGIGTSDLRSFTVPLRDPQFRPVVDGWSVAALDPPLDDYYAAVAARDGIYRLNPHSIDAAALL
ncbi:MAG: 4-phosphopantetheinyl transferase [Thermoanaerobaculia bacterium]|nr:4-phosphopantetheinyl transferase [Thermoanaerobaculia bacterium]